MRIVPDAMTQAWHSSTKIGDQRPTIRAIIQKQNAMHFEYDTAWAQGGVFEATKHRSGHFTSMIFGDNSKYRELRNIKTCEWERGIGQDAGTCTIVLTNSEIMPIGNPTNNPASPDEFDRPGHFTFSRGDQRISQNRWGYDDETGWNDVIMPDMVVKTFEGYGCDRTVTPPLDDHLVQTGVWMIDKVTYTHTGDITLEMRDLARLLLDAVVFPPAVPMAEYPLTWVSNHSENIPGRDVTGGSWTDRLNRYGHAASSNDDYIGGSFTNNPYARYVSDTGGVEGHHANDAIRVHSGTGDDLDVYWRSTGQDSKDSWVWWQFDSDTGAIPIGGLRLRMAGGPYRVYISIDEGNGWVGPKKIHYRRNGEDGSPGDVDIDGNIPFIASRIADRFFAFDVILPRVYNAHKIRLTFTHLRNTGIGEHPYRAGLREMLVYTGDNVSFQDGGHLKVIGNYGDYCLDESTEILTKRGWLGWADVQPGDETLAVNQETGCSEWTVIESVFREPRQRKMYSLEGQLHSSLSTPDHKWLMKDHAGRMIWATSETMKTGQAIPLTASRGDHPTGKKYEDDFVELVAWWWTEGNLDGVGGEIGQSPTVNPEYVARIRGLLRRLYGEPGPMRRSTRVGPEVVQQARVLSESGLTDHAVGKTVGVSNKTIKAWRERGWESWALWNETRNKRGLALFNLSQRIVGDLLQVCEGPERVVTPEFLVALTQEQLSLYIESSLDADGCRSGAKRITQSSEARIRAFEMACALAGIATSVTMITWRRDHHGWALTLLKRQFTYPQNMKREIVDYEGIIWCPTLKHGNWLARRNGKVFFTGNSHIVKWVCAWAGFYWPGHGTGKDFIRVQDGPEDTITDWITFNNPDPALPKGRVWGDFMRSGTSGVADLTVDMFDKKPLMDIINYVRDLLGFVFFIDELGGVIWRMPNLWALGNYLSPQDVDHMPGKRGRHGRTSEIVTLDEEDTLFSYTTVLDSANLRDRIFVGNAVGGLGVVIKGFNPNPIGLRRTGGWTDQRFDTRREAKVMADMISAQEMFSYRTGQATIPGYPAIQVDDQIRIFERVTNETYYHYVMGIKSSMDMEAGTWTYDLSTHWLGERPSDAWVVNVDELDQATQKYLRAVGYSPQNAEDNDDMVGGAP